MKILLDTQSWLWWIADPEKLNHEALDYFKNNQNDLMFSAASSWEISIKYAIGKLELSEPPSQFIPTRLVRDSITSMPVEHVHALHVSGLPHHHRDPFDRLLIAQSQIENLPILTADKQFNAYDVQIIKAN